MNLPKRQSFSAKMLLLVALAVVFVVTAAAAFYPQEQHCAGQDVYPIGVVPPDEPSRPILCFTTQAEAIRYATNGRIDLPNDASWEEIDAALRNQ